MKLKDLQDCHFEYNDAELNFAQAWEAKDWMKRHLLHVFILIEDIEQGYPPTEDKNNPTLWKAEHWHWYISSYIKCDA